jgi:Fe-S-cluster-containing hydrogenase component 2
MITIDNGICTECGTCVRLLGRYCINKIDDKIEIDYSVCSECQKCIAVCPQMAFANNGKFPERIEKPLRIKAEDFIELLKRRRSIKHFKDIKIPIEILKSVADVSQYAPTTNKKIEVIIIDDEKRIKQIDEAAMKFIRRIYTSLFKINIYSDS